MFQAELQQISQEMDTTDIGQKLDGLFFGPLSCTGAILLLFQSSVREPVWRGKLYNIVAISAAISLNKWADKSLGPVDFRMSRCLRVTGPNWNDVDSQEVSGTNLKEGWWSEVRATSWKNHLQNPARGWTPFPSLLPTNNFIYSWP